MTTNTQATALRIRKLTFSALYLAIALVLPFLTGQIPEVGTMLCPMHIPALLCGFVCGWPWGLAVGFISPLLRAVMIANPMTAPMESFRAVCFSSGEVSVLMWVISLAWTVVLLGVGISLFGKVEKTFVDTV